VLIDRIRLDGIATPFLKRATLEGSGDRTRWTLLADTTVFDLPDQDLRQTEVAFDAGEYRYLRVTWDGGASARVAGVGRASARLSDGAVATGPTFDITWEAQGGPQEPIIFFGRVCHARSKSRQALAPSFATRPSPSRA
jgi:hypothetical protein